MKVVVSHTCLSNFAIFYIYYVFIDYLFIKTTAYGNSPWQSKRPARPKYAFLVCSRLLFERKGRLKRPLETKTAGKPAPKYTNNPLTKAGLSILISSYGRLRPIL